MPAGDWYDDVTYTKFCLSFFFFQAEDGIRDYKVTGVQTCALPILQPGGEFRLAPKRAQPIERAHERVLGELTRQLVVSRQAVGQSVDTIHVGVVQRALRGAVPGPDFGYQFAFVHQTPSGKQGAASVNSVTRRSVGGLRGAGGRRVTPASGGSLSPRRRARRAGTTRGCRPGSTRRTRGPRAA